MRDVLVRQVVDGVLAVPELMTQTGLTVGRPEVKGHVGVWPPSVQGGVYSGHRAGPRDRSGAHLSPRLQVEVGVLRVLLESEKKKGHSLVLCGKK